MPAPPRLTAGRRAVLVMLLGAAVLAGAANLRGAEYDEQYTVFLLAGDARPAWPNSLFSVGAVRDRFHGHATPLGIAADLRRTDVHPPLYFWAVSAWSRLAGDTLQRLRLFSVLCGLGALAMVGLIARRIGVPAALAMLLTLGCYAFAYTASIARGFALAQVLALLGLWAAAPGAAPMTARRAGAAGLLLGAASFANYLAAFMAVPVVLVLGWRRRRDGALAAAGVGAFAAADLYFFAAQRDSRVGQFVPFHLIDGLGRLGKYAAASIAGGLPLYVPPAAAAAVAAVGTAIVLGLAVLVAVQWPRIATPSARVLLIGATLATPAGLLLLGLIFNTTPIELRYLAFASPPAALLAAGALASVRGRGGAICTAAVLALQAAAIAGLLLRPETMQPMRDVARAARGVAGTDTVVLLPRGNDGVGIVGAFLTEAPDTLRVRLVEPHTRPDALHGLAPRVALALLDRDADSHATIASLLAGFAADPCWRALPGGSSLAIFETACGNGQWASSTSPR